MSNTIENNRLIAEFMEIKPLQIGNRYSISKDHCTSNCTDREETILGFCKMAKYYSNWEWLMEVVEAIEQIQRSKWSKNTYACVSISFLGCKISFHGNQEEIITFIVRTSKIEAVYDACVEFIQWYNQQSK